MVRIQGSVWNDEDGNSLNSAAELGVGGVTINLYVFGETSILTSIDTRADGSYSFDGLSPDQEYSVEVRPGEGYVFSPVGNDNDVTATPGDIHIARKEQICVGPGGTAQVDAAVYGKGDGVAEFGSEHPHTEPGSISGIAFVDLVTPSRLVGACSNFCTE